MTIYYFQVSGNILSPTVPAASAVSASDSLISSYPEFNWFGEFLDDSTGTFHYVSKCLISDHACNFMKLELHITVSSRK